MNWIKDNTIIKKPPNNAYGFIYVLEYSDGTKYIGKKQFYSVISKAPLNNKAKRAGHSKFTRKKIKGKFFPREIIRKESNWQNYEGSNSVPSNISLVKKTILVITYSKLFTTYLEAKYLFSLGVLEDNTYRNANILGTFMKERFIK